MKSLARSVVMIGAAALFADCGGSQLPMTAPVVSSDNGDALPNHKTFKYTGKRQTFIVPAGVKRLTVVAHGGEGAGFNAYPSTAPPGLPGRVYAIIPVHAGDKFYVFVGGSGDHGGFNGGGAGGAAGSGSYSGNPGGGASDVRMGGDTLHNRIIVAAGGGGAGQAILYYDTAYGGNGGGLRGKLGGSGGGGTGVGGEGGTQRKGGSGGAGGSCYYSSYCGQQGGDGALGVGGNGGAAKCHYAGGGGGAGGGYYGGGGGGGGGAYYVYRYGCINPGQGGGGGGGSSYIEPSAVKSRMWTGWKTKGDGLVVFSWN